MKASLASGAFDLEYEAFSEVEVFATNTQDAMSLGCLSAFGGIFNVVETRLKIAGLGEAQWFLTGGAAEIVAPQMRAPFTLVPELVLDGLARMT